jgi:hypothetical protein
LEWEIENRYILSLLCANFGDIHLYLICPKIPMDGGAERRLNIGAFLGFLQSEHFINVQCIFFLCGKTKGLFVNDIKRACPSVQTIVHSKWLMINGSMVEIQEGEGVRIYWTVKHPLSCMFIIRGFGEIIYPTKL